MATMIGVKVGLDLVVAPVAVAAAAAAAAAVVMPMVEARRPAAARGWAASRQWREQPQTKEVDFGSVSVPPRLSL